MLTFTPEHWKDYELLDCGNFEKLERFGSVILRRPEPQALWDKVWDEIEWKKLTDITFKHVGIFPEQAANWDYIFNHLKAIEQPKFLNLFAYTGGASIAAKAAGADVTHVDSVKQVIGWSRENMEASKLDNIRWVVEDAMKFVKRELKRGKTYHGIILDPPAYGIGANGERWQLEDSINELLKDIAGILDPKEHFLILNVYSLGLSALLVQNLVQQNFHPTGETENGELYLQAKSGVQLPLGILSRHTKK